MVWVSGSNADELLNLDDFHVLSVAGSGSNWTITAFVLGVNQRQLKGTWATESAAQDAARKLVDSVDPSTY